VHSLFKSTGYSRKYHNENSWEATKIVKSRLCLSVLQASNCSTTFLAIQISSIALMHIIFMSYDLLKPVPQERIWQTVLQPHVVGQPTWIWGPLMQVSVSSSLLTHHKQYNWLQTWPTEFRYYKYGISQEEVAKF
jgi:hypothetical protein